MVAGKFVAYYRVSTKRQGESGLGLEAQKCAVTGYLNGGQCTLIDEFVEVESGAKNNRPKLTEALDLCKRQGATLVIAKLDRLARNVAFVANLMNSKVEFIAVDFPTANRLTIHILAAVAEHERDMISKRIIEALQVAKRNGKKLGWSNPARKAKHAVACRTGADNNRTNADKFAAEMEPIINGIRGAGIVTLSGISLALNMRGIMTARGGMWHPTTVKNVIARATTIGIAAAKANGVYNEVLALFTAGVSKAQIAKQLGIGVARVNQITQVATDRLVLFSKVNIDDLT
jgi:DNA invertase Pin-like site-specific DNA recombinase